MKPRNCLSRAQILHFVAVGLFLVWPAAAGAQTVVATIPVGTDIPRAVAVNPVTNKIYVASCTFHHFAPSSGSLTVIDGATNATTVIKGCFTDVAVNSVTNKIYVPSAVIDGATNAVTNFSGGVGGNVVAVNPVTNKIYVASVAGYTYVIDGAEFHQHSHRSRCQRVVPGSRRYCSKSSNEQNLRRQQRPRYT